MKRAGTLALALAAITLRSASASAQVEPTAPPDAAPSTQEVRPTVAGPPASTVRLHLRSYRDKIGARVFSRRPDDSWIMVCATPCTVDVAAGTELRLTMGSYEDEPHSYIVPGDQGSEVNVEVKPASVGPLVGGIVMMGAGGAFAVVGLLMLSVAEIGRGASGDGFKTAGYVVLGIGAVSAVGGLLWLLNRSHEPRTYDSPTRRQVYGRAETLLGDVATLRPRDPSTSVPPPATPLRYGFTF